MLKKLLRLLTEWLAAKSGLQDEINSFLEVEINRAYELIKERADEDIQALKKENTELSNRISRMKEQSKKEQEYTAQLLGQLRKFEDKTHRAVSYATDLQFVEASCNKPFLWICGDPAVHNSGSFARIMDRLKKLCPRLDLVIFTPTGTEITDLDDDDLNRMGLARIFPGAEAHKRIASES